MAALPIPLRPTYQRLLTELRRALETVEAVLADTSCSGRVRWRCIKCRDRINTVLRAAKEE